MFRMTVDPGLIISNDNGCLCALTFTLSEHLMTLNGQKVVRMKYSFLKLFFKLNISWTKEHFG